MPDTLPAFPVDDVMLAAVEHALGGALTFQCTDGAGPQLVGADYSLSTLLDFLSGYDPANVSPVLNEYDQPIPDWVEYVGGPLYHPHDVIRSLIAEVRRLRDPKEPNA